MIDREGDTFQLISIYKKNTENQTILCLYFFIDLLCEKVTKFENVWL